MSYSLLRLNDDSYPEQSPLRGASVTIEKEVWDVPHYDYPEYVWVVDPEWTFTDSSGHEHYRDGDEFPTLRAVWEEDDGGYCCEDCGGDYETYRYISHYECIGCGEHLKTGGVGKKKQRYTPPQGSYYTSVTMVKYVGSGYDIKLLGDIDPYEISGSSDGYECTYHLRYDQWIRVVEENNRLVRLEAGDVVPSD